MSYRNPRNPISRESAWTCCFLLRNGWNLRGHATQVRRIHIYIYICTIIQKLLFGGYNDVECHLTVVMRSHSTADVPNEYIMLCAVTHVFCQNSCQQMWLMWVSCRDGRFEIQPTSLGTPARTEIRHDFSMSPGNCGNA